jgi:hypothetical protein
MNRERLLWLNVMQGYGRLGDGFVLHGCCVFVSWDSAIIMPPRWCFAKSSALPGVTFEPAIPNG